MSEKRFIENFSYLINYPKHHCVFDGRQQKNLELDEIIGLLNILHQENQRLNMSPRCDPNEIESMVKEIYCLKEENEQLKESLNKIPKSIREVWLE